MLFSVEQGFVGRNEIRAPLKMPSWEAKKVQAFSISSECKTLTMAQYSISMFKQ